MHIRAHAEVNDSTYVEGCLRTDMDFMHTGEDDNSTNTYMDNLYVQHTFGNNTSLKLGKFDKFSGQNGLFYDGDRSAVWKHHISQMITCSSPPDMDDLKTGEMWK